jgi:hypothetical protein
VIKFFLATAILMLPQLASADEKEAEACLRTKVWDGYADGWAIRTMTAATLASGATRNYLITFYKGNEYQIQACGDAASNNVDLVLYDLNGTVVQRDDSKDQQPVLKIKPDKTATYYIVVHAQSLNEGQKESGVSVAVTYR